MVCKGRREERKEGKVAKEMAGEIALQMDGWMDGWMEIMEAWGWGEWSSPVYCYCPCHEIPPRQEVT